MPTSFDPMEFLIGIASSVAASILVVAFVRYRRWFRFRGLRQRWKLAGRLQEAGVIHFFTDRSQYAERSSGGVYEYLETAQDRIDIAGYWLAEGQTIQGVANDLVRLLSRKDRRHMTVSISLIDPFSPHLQSLADYLEPEVTVASVRSSIQTSLNSFYAAREAAPIGAGVKDRFEIMTYTALPIASAIMLDHGETYGRIQLDFKPFQESRKKSFTIELAAGSEFYQRCANAWWKIVHDGPRDENGLLALDDRYSQPYTPAPTDEGGPVAGD